MSQQSISPPANAEPACRLCGVRLHRTLIDLGALPLANRTVAADEADDPSFRLHVRLCDTCTLAQVDDVLPFASIEAPRRSLRSPVGQIQDRRYADTIRDRLRLGGDSLVIEVGGSALLPYFKASGISVLTIEPWGITPGIGLPTDPTPFNTETAMDIAVRYGRADFVASVNVLPYVANLFDCVAGLASILRPNGILGLQVPHLLSLVQKLQFDAFRHDCYTYLSLVVLERLLRSVGLRVFDAEMLPDCGGSLRLQACHSEGPFQGRPGLKAVRMAESIAEQGHPDFYSGFAERAVIARDEITDFLRTRHAAGRKVAAYGAGARGTTLLNCCGMTAREIISVGTRNADNEGQVLAGSRIPVVSVETLIGQSPDDILILNWPLAAEAVTELMPLRHRGTQFWTALPRITRI